MATAAQTKIQPADQIAATTPDLAAVKTRQQAAWSSGDYAIVGTTLQIVGEELRAKHSIFAPGRRSSMSPPATATSASPPRAAGAMSSRPTTCRRCWSAAAPAPPLTGLTIEFKEADAEALPFADDSFDVVVSTFGVMFTPNQERAAAELVRVCRSGGRIGLANWTAEGFIGQLFKTLGKYLPPTRGRAIAGALGHARPSHRDVRTRIGLDQDAAALLQLPLPPSRSTSSTSSRPFIARC